MGQNACPTFRQLAQFCRFENLHKISSFSNPSFGEGAPPIVVMRLQIWLTFQHVAKFDWVLLRDLPLRTMAKKQHTPFTRAGNCDDPTFQRLWTKIHEILSHHRGPFAVPTPFPAGVYSMFLSEDIRKSRNHQKSDQMYNFFGPNFFGRDDPSFLRQIIRAIYCLPRLAKLGWVLLAGLRLRSLAIQYNTESMEREIKTSVLF